MENLNPKEQKDVLFLLRLATMRGAQSILNELDDHPAYTEAVKAFVKKELEP